MDTTSMSSQPEDRESSAQPTQSTGKPLTPNQEAARLRRERRNAKIQGGGSARLEAISRLNGRKGGGNDEGKEKEGCGVGAGMGVEFGTDSAEKNISMSNDAEGERSEIPSNTMDPDVSVPTSTNISSSYRGTPSPSSAQQQRRPISSSNVNVNSNADLNANTTTQPDPILQAMRQMLASQDPASTPSPSDPAAASTTDPTTALLASLLGGAGSGAAFNTQQQPGHTPAPAPAPAQARAQTQQQKAILYWRLIHALFAFSLALHILLFGHTEFNGTKRQRERQSPYTAPDSPYVDQQQTLHPPSTSPLSSALSVPTLNYWLIFLAGELALQSGRFVLGGEEGLNAAGSAGAGAAGILMTVVNFLPPPWPGYVKVSSRYWYMFRTVRADVLVLVFVLGVGGWLRG